MLNFILNAENTPLEMFSWQHFTALGVVIAIFLLVFFTRKFFIKYKIADMIFRYALGIGLITFELVLQLRHGPSALMGRFFGDSYPLCGYMIWFTAIALMSNSTRLMKIIYPLTLTGGTLSLIFIDMTCTFPAFGAFQFWFIHAGFMLGSLYFFFTKKINKYSIKDLARSCLFLFGLNVYDLLITCGIMKRDINFSDAMFIIDPPGGLEFLKDTLGQIGYTFAFVSTIVLIQFIIYGLTYLCCKHRKDEDINIDKSNYSILDNIAKIKESTRNIIIFIVFGLGIYSVVLQRSMQSKALLYVDIIIFFILMILVILNEATNSYLKNKEDIKQD